MTELCIKTSSLCRCCHAKGDFKSLSMPYTHLGKEEIYSHLLKECFDIFISPPLDTLAQLHSICNECVTSLQQAWRFKQQVLTCENKFLELYGNKLKLKAEFLANDVKQEIFADEDCDRGDLDHKFRDEEDEKPIRVEVFFEQLPAQGGTSNERENTCREREKMEENDGDDSLSD
ncbi:hypothetical protein JYU34_021639, partial [Plutella xylostella]